MAPGQSINALGRELVEQLLNDRAVQHVLGGPRCRKNIGQIEHPNSGIERLDEACRVAGQINGSGLHGSQGIARATKLSGAIHLDFDGTIGSRPPIGGEVIQRAINGMGGNIGHRHLQAKRGRVTTRMARTTGDESTPPAIANLPNRLRPITATCTYPFPGRLPAP